MIDQHTMHSQVSITRIKPCLIGFEHVNRYWDKHNEHFTAKILPGEFYVTKLDEMITTVLGSCIAVCAFDPCSGLGGMNHFMLPNSGGESTDILSKSFRFGDVAMERMINEMIKAGANVHQIVFKAFGGGVMLANMTDIGGKNIEFLHKFMQMEGLKLTASDLGGPHPRKVNFYVDTGRIRMKKIEHMHNDTIARREDTYRATIDNQPDTGGDVELFD